MLGKFFGAVILGVIGLAIYLFFYLGFLSPVEIAVAPRGPLHMIYKNHSGAYHQIGPAIEAVEKWAADHNLRCALTFGEYLDDPAAIDQDRLRSRGGCLFEQMPTAPLTEDLNKETRAQRSYAIGTFKGSPSIGPWKVYPKVREYIETHRLKSGGPVIETYLIEREKVTTEFLFPVETLP